MEVIESFIGYFKLAGHCEASVSVCVQSDVCNCCYKEDKAVQYLISQLENEMSS